jgi:hypothetical protein
MEAVSGDDHSNQRMAVFATTQTADAALRELAQAGFDAGRISVFKSVPTGKAAHRSGRTLDRAVEHGGKIGAEVGGGLGALGALLARAGLIAIPRIGSVLATGPLTATFSMALTGVAIGGFAGALIALGIAEIDALASERHLKEGRIVLIVDCQSRCNEAAAILHKCGALEIGSVRR